MTTLHQAPLITEVDENEFEEIQHHLKYTRREEKEGMTIIAGKTPAGTMVVLINTMSGQFLTIAST